MLSIKLINPNKKTSEGQFTADAPARAPTPRPYLHYSSVSLSSLLRSATTGRIPLSLLDSSQITRTQHLRPVRATNLLSHDQVDQTAPVQIPNTEIAEIAEMRLNYNNVVMQ